MFLYSEVLINQGLLQKKLITVASMPTKQLRVIRSYAVSNLTLRHLQARGSLAFT